MPPSRHLVRLTIAMTAAAILAVWSSAARPSAAPAPAARPVAVAPAAAAQNAGEYVGEATCLTCHDTQDYKGKIGRAHV